MTTQLKDYQQKGVSKIVRWGGRALLADEMGLGKSLQSLAACHQEKWFPAIVICPASLKWNWEEEAKTHLNIRAEVLEGTKARKPTKLIKPPPLTIINYDILENWIPYLASLNPQCLIPDEVHYLKNKTTKRYKLAKELSLGGYKKQGTKRKRIPRIIALSGTPLTNRPSELWTILNLIWPEHFRHFFPWARHYCKPRRTPWGMDYSGASNLDELHRTLKKDKMIRRLKKHVLKELPEKIRTTIPIKLPIKAQREYDKALNNFVAWLKEKSPEKARRAAKAKQLTKGTYLKRLVAELKLPAVFDWVDNFLEESDGKLILFGIHTAVLKPIRDRYKNISVLVNGKVTGKKRQIAVKAFQNRKEKRLFIGNIQAAGVGLTLTAASDVLLVEFPWTPGEVEQAIDRAHRIGQRKVVNAWFMTAKGTIEEKLIKLLGKKQNNLDQILDGKGTQNDFNVFDELLKSLKPKGLMK